MASTGEVQPAKREPSFLESLLHTLRQPRVTLALLATWAILAVVALAIAVSIALAYAQRAVVVDNVGVIYAVQEGWTAAAFLDRPFYHPTLEEGLQSAVKAVAERTGGTR